MRGSMYSRKFVPSRPIRAADGWYGIFRSGGSTISEAPTSHRWAGSLTKGWSSATPSTENDCVSRLRQYPWRSGLPLGVRGGLNDFAFWSAQVCHARFSVGHPAMIGGRSGVCAATRGATANDRKSTHRDDETQDSRQCLRAANSSCDVPAPLSPPP